MVRLTCKPKAVKVTGHYRSRGFSDSGVIDDSDDKQDTDDDSQEQHCVNKYYSHESPPTFGGCTDDRNQPHHRICVQAGDQTTRNSCTISSSSKNCASLAIKSSSADNSKLESPMQVIFSPSEDTHPMKQVSGIVFTLPPTKNIHSKETAAKGTDTNSTKPTNDRSCKTAIEHSGQSNFKDTRNNGDDAPANSHNLEPQEGCLASNAQDASNIDG